MKKKLLYALLMCFGLNWHIKDTVRQQKSTNSEKNTVPASGAKSVTAQSVSKKPKQSRASRTSYKGKPITAE